MYLIKLSSVNYSQLLIMHSFYQAIHLTNLRRKLLTTQLKAEIKRMPLNMLSTVHSIFVGLDRSCPLWFPIGLHSRSHF